MLEGVLEPLSSIWSTPVVLVTEKDYVDYRKLNGQMEKEIYLLLFA